MRWMLAVLVGCSDPSYVLLLAPDGPVNLLDGHQPRDCWRYNDGVYSGPEQPASVAFSHRPSPTTIDITVDGTTGIVPLPAEFPGPVTDVQLHPDYSATWSASFDPDEFYVRRISNFDVLECVVDGTERRAALPSAIHGRPAVAARVEVGTYDTRFGRVTLIAVGPEVTSAP